jgi:hypothetical protein
MGFTGVDDIVSERTTSAKNYYLDVARTIDTGATSAAGRWHSLITTGGTGGAMTVTGTAGTGIAFNRSTVGALPLNANVATDTRHLQAFGAISASTVLAPGMLLLTDIIHVYPSCALTGTPSTLSNHPTWTGTGDTRMTSAAGVMASILTTTATTAGNGQITLSYLDQDGNAGTAGSLYAPSTTTPTGCFWAAGGAAVTNGPIMAPLAAGDLGVQRVSSYTINTGATTGVGAIILHRPIARIPIIAANTASERALLNDTVQLPRIHDDACLALFVQIGGALTTGQSVQAWLDMAWG